MARTSLVALMRSAVERPDLAPMMTVISRSLDPSLPRGRSRSSRMNLSRPVTISYECGKMLCQFAHMYTHEYHRLLEAMPALVQMVVRPNTQHIRNSRRHRRARARGRQGMRLLMRLCVSEASFYSVQLLNVIKFCVRNKCVAVCVKGFVVAVLPV